MLRGRMCGIPLCFPEKSQVFTFAGNAKWRRRYPGRQRRVRHQLHPGLCTVRKKIVILCWMFFSRAFTIVPAIRAAATFQCPSIIIQCFRKRGKFYLLETIEREWITTANSNFLNKLLNYILLALSWANFF